MKTMLGGVLDLLEELEVGLVIINKQIEDSENYQKFLNIVKEKKIIVKQVKMGERILIEKDLYIDVLWPAEVQISENPLNNNSIVCKLNYEEFSMLFTGDIEEVAEEKILKQLKQELLEADVLKVGHHGSKTSSTEEFIKVVNPKIALIGVGENNKFGHPNEGVIERLKSLRCENL